MKFELNDKLYDVIVVKKNNKNSYIRVQEDLSILVTTSYFTTKNQINRMLNDNRRPIEKMLNRQIHANEKNERFFYLGKSYDIIEVSIMDDIEFEADKIYIPNKKKFEKWYKSKLVEVFNSRLEYNFKQFSEIENCPSLKIRDMKTRWGVYNRVKHCITLNSKLLKYDYDVIDYVIIHELSHVIHFNHSKLFWELVSKYCPNYKKIKLYMKE